MAGTGDLHESQLNVLQVKGVYLKTWHEGPETVPRCAEVVSMFGTHDRISSGIVGE
jgi:hypothetical protein